MTGAQLELPLVPHDGSPLSFLAALRCYLDGFNPDRAQIEKQRHRVAILTALEKVQALDPAHFHTAKSWFPEVRLPQNLPPMPEENGPKDESPFVDRLAWQEPQFPLLMPNVAPSAPRARGTPVSALPLAASPLRLSCNRGLSPFPTSMTPCASLVALGFGMRGNSAPAF
jgi:hypothetical protein